MNDAYRCPSCSQELVKTNSGVGLLWVCSGCEGRAVTLSFLRRGVETDFLNQVWQQARASHATQKLGHRACPGCSQKMPLVVVPTSDDEQLVLDVCPLCQFIWLDAGEIAQLPIKTAAPESVKPDLSPEAKEAVALAQVEAWADRRNDLSDYRPMVPGLPELIAESMIRAIFRL